MRVECHCVQIYVVVEVAYFSAIVPQKCFTVRLMPPLTGTIYFSHSSFSERAQTRTRLTGNGEHLYPIIVPLISQPMFNVFTASRFHREHTGSRFTLACNKTSNMSSRFHISRKWRVTCPSSSALSLPMATNRRFTPPTSLAASASPLIWLIGIPVSPEGRNTSLRLRQQRLLCRSFCLGLGLLLLGLLHLEHRLLHLAPRLLHLLRK